jgi:hypothetical protein
MVTLSSAFCQLALEIFPPQGRAFRGKYLVAQFL